MKIKYLKNKQEPNLNAKVMACLNRGIDAKDIPNYLSRSIEHIYDAEELGEPLLRAGARRLIECISNNKKCFIIVDSDCDGMTSAAHLINYLYEIFPAWTESYLSWGLHEGKQHGINDFLDSLLTSDYSLLITPDAGTNDIEAIEKLHEINCETLILDHHISDVSFSEYAVTINSQYDYPNKDLSGVGVVHKFCEYLDKLLNKDIANKFKDLTAIGLMGDMQSMTSLETKEMILDGLQEVNIINPLIDGLTVKNEFALSKADYEPSPNNNLKITPMGAAFFIIPLLNAICRSGTMDDKKQVFDAMLTMKAFEIVPSTKRGHKAGETERILDQALRTCTNVKNRQTKAEDVGMTLLTERAETMLDNKVLVFCLEPGEIDPNIAGLVANKLASKYQRPVCVTKKVMEYSEDSMPWDDDEPTEIYYSGSMRGYTATGIDNFKEIAESSSACAWVRGHENAAGLRIDNPDKFVLDMNNALKDVSTDIVYYVDYIYHDGIVDGDAIIDLAELNDYLGTNFPRPQVYVDNCKIDNFMIMKDQHLKISLNGCDAIIWSVDKGLKERLENGEVIYINFVAKPNINTWGFERSPQLIIIDYEEVDVKPKNVIDAWGF